MDVYPVQFNPPPMTPALHCVCTAFSIPTSSTASMRRRKRAALTKPAKPAPPAAAKKKMDHFAASPWATLRRALLAALYYISASVSLTLFNKLLFQRWPVTSPVLVLFSQALITLVILSLLSSLRIPATFNPRTLTRAQHVAHIPLFLSYLGMLLFGLAALQQTSLLMYHTLRRTSIVPVLILQAIVTGARPTRATLVATFLIVCGAFAAVATNLRFEIPAYALATLANFATAYYLVQLKAVRDDLNLTNLQLLFLNNLYALPGLLCLLFIVPVNLDVLAMFRYPEFCFLFVSSASFALILNHAVYVNTTVNDAVAHTVSTQVKDVVLLVVSIVFVDNPLQRSPGMLRGALIAFAGSLVYAIGKVLANFRERQTDFKLGDDRASTVNRPLMRAEDVNGAGDDAKR